MNEAVANIDECWDFDRAPEPTVADGSQPVSLPGAVDPMDVPVDLDISVECDGTTLLVREHFWLTCRWRDGGAGAPIMISF